MSPQARPGFAFIALAIAFFAIGLSTNSVFYILAIVFLVIGLGMINRGR
jgi:hypothetical protein